MKSVSFHFRILLMMILLCATLDRIPVYGQCSTCSTDNRVQIGQSAGVSSATGIAIGEATVTGAVSFAYGNTVFAKGDQSFVLGHRVEADDAYEWNYVFGRGDEDYNLLNNVSNSIMMGMNSNVSTLFIGGSSGVDTWGNVGIGNITAPASLLHVRDQVRVGKSASDNGSIVFNNSSNSNDVTIQSGVTTPSSYTLTLPVAAPATSGFALVATTAGVLSWADLDANAWKLTGNAGTTAGTHFLGTTDAVDLVFRTSNLERMRVLSGGNVGIGTSLPTVRLHVLAEDISGQEPIARFSTDDAAYGFLQLKNQASTNTEFAASFTAKGDAENKPALQFISITDYDAGDEPILEFDCRYDNGSSEVAPTSRPIFQLRVPGTGGEKLLVDAAGNLGVGTTSPSSLLDVQGTGGTSPVHIRTNGSMEVGGTYNTSDALFKNQIEEIVDALGLIDHFIPRTYYYDTLNFNGVGKFSFGSEKQYGFVAQEVEQVFPELVHYSIKPEVTDSLGNIVLDSYAYRSLNYTALIPILTKGIQELRSENSEINADVVELQEQIEQLTLSNSELRDQVQQLIMAVSACCDRSSASFRLDEESAGISSENKQTNVVLSDRKFVVLEQNVPNPFAERTKIDYVVPREASSATILFYDALGHQIQSVLIETGSGSVEVFASDLSSGVYTYTLVIDGKVVESKRMTKTN